MPEYAFLLTTPEGGLIFLDLIDLYQYVKRTWPAITRDIKQFHEMDESIRTSSQATLYEGIRIQKYPLKSASSPFLAKN